MLRSFFGSSGYGYQPYLVVMCSVPNHKEVLTLNLIEELYFGAVCPSTKIKIQSPAYHKAMSNLSQNEELLTNLLEGKEKKLFLDIMNDYTTTQGELTVAHFVAGFRLGAGLMAEVSPAKIEPYLRE